MAHKCPHSPGPMPQMTVGCNQQSLKCNVYFVALTSWTRLKLTKTSRAKVKGLSLFWSQFLKPVAVQKHFLSRYGLRATQNYMSGYMKQELNSAVSRQHGELVGMVLVLCLTFSVPISTSGITGR